ncbi:MAG: class I SAM-dependent methyltransferase [Rhodospirillales bacterium]|nr:class I SAM-dependent methyltransferase [Rhodospirillales bacterium]
MSDNPQSSSTDPNWTKRSEQWVKAAPVGASTSDSLNQRLIEFAGIVEGHHVLDLASGTGEPSISIAIKVGPSGAVTATDATPNMLETAEKRAAGLGLEQISFQVTPMEELPFEDAAFDAVTCRFGLMHAIDPVAAINEALRVLKPGGRAAFVVHGPADQNNLWAVVHLAAPEFFGRAKSANYERHFKFSGEGEAGKLFADAGYSAIEEDFVVTEQRHPAGSQFWQGALERGFADDMAGLDDAGIEALNLHLTAAFARYLEGGEYILTASQRITRGTA